MKEYRVTVSFGDGNPKAVTIEAESGYAAHVKAFNSFAGARQVHVLGLVSNSTAGVQASSKPVLMYGKDYVKANKPKIIPIYLENNEVNPIVLQAIELRKKGVTQEKIAKTLGISRGTVRRLLNANV